MPKYRTDSEMLEFLENRIKRLEKTLARQETLGMTSISNAGNSKVFEQTERIQLALDRAENEYHIISSRLNGVAVNPQFKEPIICSRKHY